MKKNIYETVILLLMTIIFSGCLTVEIPDTFTWEGKKYIATKRVYLEGMVEFVKIGSQNGFDIYENKMGFEDTIFIKNSDGYLEYEWEYKPQLMRKPNIYLYPKKETEIEVTLKFGGELITSYPKYNNGWRVKAKPDGTLMNSADGKEYSYLFWEGKCNSNWNITSGFIVKGEDVTEFLQEKLSYMGLIPREYNEFIVYWLPELEKNKYNLISFVNEEYAQSVQLNVSPKPDSILRVFMVYKELDSPIKIKTQRLKSFKREGFTVVEWGGSCLSE